MKRISLFLTMCAIVLLSCENKLEDGGIYISNNTEQTSSPYHITLEQALNNMYSTMDALNLGTRAKCRVVKDVQLIPSARRQTRSGDALGAFYVVNFENDEGFAILAADTRISADVIGIGEQGNFEYVPIEESMTRSGVIDTLDTSADVLTLDDLYVPEEDDYLLGGGEDDGNNFLSRAIDILDSNIENPIDNGEGGGGTSYRYDTIVVSTAVDSLILTKWGQHQPFYGRFDKYYRYCTKPGDTIKRKRPYNFDYNQYDGYVDTKDIAIGCITTAVLQTLAYNEFPSTNEILNTTECISSWNSLSQNIKYSNFSNEVHREHIARLAYSVAQGCNVIVGFCGTTSSFSTPKRVRDYLRSIGYTNVTRHLDVDFSVIKERIDDDCPVILGALSNRKGHAWIVDGYEILTTKRVKKTLSGTVVEEQILNTTNYVHCNWGWDGRSNGFFIVNLFKVSLGEGENRQDFNYSCWQRMVTYDKPNN